MLTSYDKPCLRNVLRSSRVIWLEKQLRVSNCRHKNLRLVLQFHFSTQTKFYTIVHFFGAFPLNFPPSLQTFYHFLFILYKHSKGKINKTRFSITQLRSLNFPR